MREKRYSLLYEVQKILGNDFRVSRCQKFTTGKVQVFFSSKFQRTHLTGLVTCGSVWVCPVCSAKITSKRSEILKNAIEHHYSHGGSILMMTLTAPHKLDDSLTDNMKLWREALTNLHSSYAYKNFNNSTSNLGHVRSLEVTFSEKSGWHVHAHYLMFLF